MAVYDLHGGLVRTLVEEHQVRGHHELRWDGRDGAGAPVASGVYVVRLDAAGESRSVKATLVR